MNLDDFKKIALVDKTLTEKTISWKGFSDGKEKDFSATFFVAEASHSTMADVVKEARDAGMDPRTEYLYIASYIRDKDGKRVFSYTEAAEIKPEIVALLYPITIEQFAGMRDPKKASRQKKTSGVS